MTLDPRLLKRPSVRALRALLAPTTTPGPAPAPAPASAPEPVRRWSAQDVALSPADRYRREVELEDAIRTLPDDLRTVFQLSYWHDLVHSEIAEALGMPLGTVAARISLATKQLRHLLVAA
jgi:RNA polymerase sigma-70 factor (ECF subfamily)